MPDLDPATIARLGELFRAAKAIEKSIIEAGIQISDLGVAVSGRIVTLGGRAASPDVVRAAIAVAYEHPDVDQVISGILVG